MADGQPFVIWVVFEAKPGAFEKLYQAALDDSTCSVRDEPGCLQFDVLAPIAGGNTLAFYEVYKSRDAFAAHMETPHFKRFASVAEEVVSAKQVWEYSRLQAAAKPSKG